MTLKSSSPYLNDLVPMAEYIYSGIFNTKLKNSYNTCGEVWSAKLSSHADRATSWLQNLWLDAMNLLEYVLEKAEQLELPAEVIGPITSVVWQC